MAQPLIDPDQLNLNPTQTGVGIFMPVGGVIPYAGSVAPGGYVLCDGDEYPENDPQYAPLFAVIGPTYNTGGETPGFFRVPNLVGRTVVMVDGGTFSALGDDVGDKDATLVTHSHTDTFSIGSESAHTHSDTLSIETGGGSHSHSGTFASSSHTHGYTTPTAPQTDPLQGGGAFLCSSESHQHVGTTGGPSSTSGVGSTNINHSHSLSGSIGSGSAHTHGLSGSVSSTGSSATDANIQPSFVLNYIISLGL